MRERWHYHVLSRSGPASLVLCSGRHHKKIAYFVAPVRGRRRTRCPGSVPGAIIEHAWLRAAALEAIGRIGYKDSNTVDTLIRILQTDQEHAVRSKAAYALGIICEREPKAVDALVQALETDREGTVRASAALALGRIGGKDPRVVEALIYALTLYDDTMTTSNVAGTLQRITGRGLGTDAARWEKWWEENYTRFFEGQ